MTLSRQKFREIILQMLYSQTFVEFHDENIISFMMTQIKTTKRNILNAKNYVNRIIDCIDEIDAKIKKASISYEIERISKVELCILRLAIYEIEHEKDISFKIAISEAIRLTKKFANHHSSNFINAILDSIHHKAYEHTKK